MFCTRCGSEIKATAKFCNKCGKPVKGNNKAVDDDCEMKRDNVKVIIPENNWFETLKNMGV